MPGQRSTTNAAPPATRSVQSEIAELVTLMDYRLAVLSEAQVQANSILQYYCGMLMFSQNSHPYTYLLATFALEAGLFVVLYFKNCQYPLLDGTGKPVLDNNCNPIFEGPRPRPSQICPWLMPPLAVPGHSSYPSGHATQSALLSLLLSQVMPPEVAQPTKYDGGTFRPSLLDKLAERIARNREVLGVHYPTDSQAGRWLAGQVYALLAPAAAGALTTGALAAAAPLTPQASAAVNMIALLGTLSAHTNPVATNLNGVATAVAGQPNPLAVQGPAAASSRATRRSRLRRRGGAIRAIHRHGDRPAHQASQGRMALIVPTPHWQPLAPASIAAAMVAGLLLPGQKPIASPTPGWLLRLQTA